MGTWKRSTSIPQNTNTGQRFGAHTETYEYLAEENEAKDQRPAFLKIRIIKFASTDIKMQLFGVQAGDTFKEKFEADFPDALIVQMQDTLHFDAILEDTAPSVAFVDAIAALQKHDPKMHNVLDQIWHSMASTSVKSYGESAQGKQLTEYQILQNERNAFLRKEPKGAHEKRVEALKKVMAPVGQTHVCMWHEKQKKQKAARVIQAWYRQHHTQNTLK